jgi:hypothetical protein
MKMTLKLQIMKDISQKWFSLLELKLLSHFSISLSQNILKKVIRTNSNNDDDDLIDLQTFLISLNK